jgi:hypothetical protein
LTSGNYTSVLDVGNKTTATISPLVAGTKYYFVVAAYNSAGVSGLPSSPVSWTAP